LSVALGAGAVINVPGVRVALGGVSVLLLLLLAWIFARSAWRALLAQRPAADAIAAPAPVARLQSPGGGYVLGFGMALTSPWNIAFWLAVIGSQAAGATPNLASSLLLASAVVAGAASWGMVLCTALSFGARFATPAWQIGTSAATAALMLYFALHALVRLCFGT
jgi:threonine/homoserine/homoserine lactone efflux protein